MMEDSTEASSESAEAAGQFPRRRTSMLKHVRTQAIGLRREGHAVKVIAHELGVSQRTCYRWFKEAADELDPTLDLTLDSASDTAPSARTRAFAMREAGYSVAEIAEELDVSLATCDGWLRLSRRQPRTRPWQQKLTPSQLETLTEYFVQHPSASLADGISMLRERFGVVVSPSTVRKHRVTPYRVAGLKDILKSLFEKDPTATPESVVEMMNTEHNMTVSVHTVLRYQEYMS